MVRVRIARYELKLACDPARTPAHAPHARNCADMSESRGRRNRSLLSSYYGTEAPDADVAAAPPAADQDDSNIDGAAFDADKYVSSLLQQRSLEELVQRGNAMVSEIKSLDSDMQMLVYENYNKFISATDTIRQMKNRVDSMESQMLQLETNMGTISTASEAVNSSLSARRSELEKLNGVKKNLTKLQFLMDLPARLQACVAAEKYELAVKFHHKAKRMLAAVGRVAAFDGIREEAALIMGRLGHGLNARLAKPDLPPDVLGSTTLLLAQLEPAREEALLKEYLSRRRRDLHDRLAAFAPEGGVATGVVMDGTGAPRGGLSTLEPLNSADTVPEAPEGATDPPTQLASTNSPNSSCACRIRVTTQGTLSAPASWRRANSRETRGSSEGTTNTSTHSQIACHSTALRKYMPCASTIRTSDENVARTCILFDIAMADAAD